MQGGVGWSKSDLPLTLFLRPLWSPWCKAERYSWVLWALFLRSVSFCCVFQLLLTLVFSSPIRAVHVLGLGALHQIILFFDELHLAVTRFNRATLKKAHPKVHVSFYFM